MPQSERITKLAHLLVYRAACQRPNGNEGITLVEIDAIIKKEREAVKAELHKALDPLLEAVAEEVNRWNMPKLKEEADKWK